MYDKNNDKIDRRVIYGSSIVISKSSKNMKIWSQSCSRVLYPRTTCPSITNYQTILLVLVKKIFLYHYIHNIESETDIFGLQAIKQCYGKTFKQFFSCWKYTLTKTYDVTPKGAILVFAYNLVQGIQCAMKNHQSWTKDD